MTNELRTQEILVKHGDYVEKVEKATKGFTIVLKPNTAVAALCPELNVHNDKGLLEAYSDLKRLISQTVVKVEKAPKAPKAKKTIEAGTTIEAEENPNMAAKEPLPPVQKVATATKATTPVRPARRVIN